MDLLKPVNEIQRLPTDLMLMIKVAWHNVLRRYTPPWSNSGKKLAINFK
jgi:hypothetical protein